MDDVFYTGKTRDLSIKIGESVYLTHPGRILNYISKIGDISYQTLDFIEKDGDYIAIKLLDRIVYKIVDKSYPSLEEVIDDIYDTYLTYCKKSDITLELTKHSKSYFLQIPIENGFRPIERINLQLKNKKIIVITRNPISSSFMNAERMYDRGYVSTKKSVTLLERIFFSHYERLLYSRNFIKKYKKFTSQINKIGKISKDVILIDFDDIILNPKSTLEYIENQTGINVADENKPSDEYMKQKDIYNKSLHPRAIKHNPEKFLNKKQILLLKFLHNGFKGIKYKEYPYALSNYLKLFVYEFFISIIKTTIKLTGIKHIQGALSKN